MTQEYYNRKKGGGAKKETRGQAVAPAGAGQEGIRTRPRHGSTNKRRRGAGRWRAPGTPPRWRSPTGHQYVGINIFKQLPGGIALPPVVGHPHGSHIEAVHASRVPQLDRTEIPKCPWTGASGNIRNKPGRATDPPLVSRLPPPLPYLHGDDVEVVHEARVLQQHRKPLPRVQTTRG